MTVVQTRESAGTGSKRLRKQADTFLRSVADLDNASILDELKKLSVHERNGVKRYAARVLQDGALKRHVALRSGSARLVVALLPETFPIFKKLLRDSSTRFWYEAQFTAFVQLDRRDLSKADQSRVLRLLERYLMTAKSKAGYAAWKGGDLLGDEWHSPETVRILERLLFSAKHVAGREAALHGIEHAINRASLSEKKRLFALIRRASNEDKSPEIRKAADLAIRGVGCLRADSLDRSFLNGAC